MTASSERFAWIQRIQAHKAKQERIRALRAELQACREAGLRARHGNKLRRNRAGDTGRKPK